MISARECRAHALPENRACFIQQGLNRPAKGSPDRGAGREVD